ALALVRPTTRLPSRWPAARRFLGGNLPSRALLSNTPAAALEHSVALRQRRQPRIRGEEQSHQPFEEGLGQRPLAVEKLVGLAKRKLLQVHSLAFAVDRGEEFIIGAH